MLKWLLVCALGACGRRGSASIRQVDPVAYALQGHVRITALPSDITQENLVGGRVNIRLYRQVEEGYCLAGGSAIAADVMSAVGEPDLAQLLSTGMPFSFSVLMAPGMQAPFTLYPVADWQTTMLRDNACERDSVTGVDHYNARGEYLPSGQSACCGMLPSPVTIAHEGDSAENIDFVLELRRPAKAECADPSKPFDRCTFKQTTCEAALAGSASQLIHRPDGGACE